LPNLLLRQRDILRKPLTNDSIQMRCLFIISGIVTFSLCYSQTSTEFSYSGKITDSFTKEPVPFASVLVSKTTKGTSTDLEGNFFLVIEGKSDFQIQISCVGYKNLVLRKKDLRRDLENDISLEPQTYELKTLIVVSKQISIESILSSAIENFKRNYHQEDFSFNIYSTRELRDFENNSPILTQMVLAEGYYQGGYKIRKPAHSANNTYFNILQHKLEGQEKKYTNYDYGLFTGYGLVILDIVRHENSPLNKSNFKDFIFKIDSVSTNKSDTIYRISFISKNTEYKTSGVMAAKKHIGFIDISLPNYVVLNYESSFLLDKDKRFTNQRNFSMDPQLLFTVRYGFIGGKYVFDYAKSSMIIYDGSSKLRFDQEFIPYNFNFLTPKKISKSNLSLTQKSDLSFWGSYQKPYFKHN
jgi:CarboxypepD_reg-like domain